ncbi:DUF6685 family protein [Azohydromonas caseinilytica]|uniref:Uncharacterized protein n=1 Tax=Azohydromonas caseinilytica TaxID=2728836 RepID=A0A848FL99_9BURK|nr:DUF6685 family protein [Azohydromonas caseinilytica]NML19119.1 hypothetical protein [Azohydromonas caseinilytica]
MPMLKKGLSLVTNLVRERFGTPHKLRPFLDENARKLQVSLDAVPGPIAAASMPRWHEWGEALRSGSVAFKAGELLGWRTQRNFGYHSYRVVLPELARFGSCIRLPDWRCDIQDVEGLQASKAELARYDSLDALALQGSPQLVDEISSARLNTLLARREIRTLRRQQSSDHFARFLWDGRVFLINSGASRQFAAARLVAARLGQKVPLCGELRVYSIEPPAVNNLRRDFELFAVSCRDVVANVRFHEALRGSRIPYLSKRMPAPGTDAEVIFLPRADRRSMAAAAELRAAGYPDVGKLLSALLLRQHMNSVRLGQGPQAEAA